MLLINRSDPEGPAETLFQEPYFQLLSDALRDGGVITTQGITPTPTPTDIQPNANGSISTS